METTTLVQWKLQSRPPDLDPMATERAGVNLHLTARHPLPCPMFFCKTPWLLPHSPDRPQTAPPLSLPSRAPSQHRDLFQRCRPSLRHRPSLRRPPPTPSTARRLLPAPPAFLGHGPPPPSAARLPGSRPPSSQRRPKPRVAAPLLAVSAASQGRGPPPPRAARHPPSRYRSTRWRGRGSTTPGTGAGPFCCLVLY
jgi:hypothetical protein